MIKFKKIEIQNQNMYIHQQLHINRQLHQNQMTSSLDFSSNNLYVVLENGELYPRLYSTYEAARAAVLDKYADTLEEQRAECAEWNGTMSSKVDVEENKETGTTRLYIEKEIFITIQRYKC